MRKAVFCRKEQANHKVSLFFLFPCFSFLYLLFVVQSMYYDSKKCPMYVLELKFSLPPAILSPKRSEIRAKGSIFTGKCCPISVLGLKKASNIGTRIQNFSLPLISPLKSMKILKNHQFSSPKSGPGHVLGFKKMPKTCTRMRIFLCGIG